MARLRQLVGGTAMGACVLVTVACHDYSTQAVLSVVDRNTVVGAAASSIDGRGQFVLAKGDGGSREITEARAKELAAAFWHDAKAFISGQAERDRGGEVHRNAIAPCARAYYAQPAYNEATGTLPVAAEKATGGYWLVGLCYGGVQEVVVAVSAQAFDVALGSGKTRLVDPGTNNFFSMGVPVGSEIPMSPETVVEQVARVARLRVKEVPVLMMRNRPASPLLSVWQVELEGAVPGVEVRTGARRSEERIFAGPMNGWHDVAFAVLPLGASNRSVTEEVFHAASDGVTRQALQLSRRAGAPADLELLLPGGK